MIFPIKKGKIPILMGKKIIIGLLYPIINPAAFGLIIGYNLRKTTQKP